jgi:(p)ppGpp synthase/HD superfamily hydrolase
VNDAAGDAPALTERFLAAVALAQEVHGSARRSGTEIPYLAHLLVVAGLVLEDGGDEDQAIAAMLHDSVEDGGGRPLLERIRRRFGERVASIVEQLSDSIEIDSDEPWVSRKRRHLTRLEACRDEAVLRVAVADKLDNARAIVREYRAEGNIIWERFADKTAEEQLWYFGRLVELFEERRPGPLTDALRCAVAELTALVAGREPGA